MKLQYFHDRLILSPRGGNTIAMEIIPVDMFHNIDMDNVLEVALGVARCSIKDNYNKKIGRSIATERLKNVELELLQSGEWEDENGRQVVEKILVDTVTGNVFTLRHKHGNELVRLVAFEEGER